MSEDTQPASAPESVAAPEATDVQPSAPVETQAEEATPSEPADDAAEEAPKKKGGGFQKRIAELTRDREDAKRERDHWRQVALQEKGIAQPTAPAHQEPRQDQFQTYEEYVSAKARFEVRQEIEQDRRRSETAREQERTAGARRTFESKMEKAKGQYTDFEDIAGSVLADPDFPISNSMAETIMESDKGPDLVYWLGNNHDEAARISRLSPLAAARELGRIEAQLASPAKRLATQAPKPPPTLKGGDAPSKDPAAMTMAEYASWRAKGGGKVA